MSGKPQSHEKRRAAIAASVEIDSNGCWLWTAHVLPNGYGQISLDGKSLYVHRASYILHVGPIPDGLHLDHKCHNRDKSCPGGWGCSHRRCVNPEHLDPVTQGENNRRSWDNRPRGKCRKFGHPLDGIRMDGGVERPYCVVCSRNRATASYDKRRVGKKVSQ